ncbi:hypothetical protein E2C01_022125 [Portunus trituberculatus]|uniref:Uncharacterized protein n=1 Tax=Portunus trituberculatus TaxID=210409 RepID=A0A5B7E4D3_PORTR|nr:hypothetical protein [Portunus trituberculatus]
MQVLVSHSPPLVGSQENNFPLPSFPSLLLFYFIHHQPSLTVSTNKNYRKIYIEIFVNLRFC